MGIKNKIKSQLRLHGFESYNCDWRHFFHFGGVATKGGILFRFISNCSDSTVATRQWMVRISFPTESNPQTSLGDSQLVSLHEWASQFGVTDLKATNKN